MLLAQGTAQPLPEDCHCLGFGGGCGLFFGAVEELMGMVVLVTTGFVLETGFSVDGFCRRSALHPIATRGAVVGCSGQRAAVKWRQPCPTRASSQYGAPVTAAVKCGAVVFECRNLRAVSGFVAGR